MFLDWTKNLTDADEKVKFEANIMSSKTILDRLTQLIDEKEASLTRTELTPSAFEDANWGYKQAFQNGYRAALNQIKILINLDDQ
jgi:hypothetical protein